MKLLKTTKKAAPKSAKLAKGKAKAPTKKAAPAAKVKKAKKIPAPKAKTPDASPAAIVKHINEEMGKARIRAYIGQPNAVAKLNAVLAAIIAQREEKKEYAVRPVRFGGFTGCGKSNLASAFARQLAELGYNYIEVAPNAGWKDLYAVFNKITSRNSETGAISAIPFVIFWDEFHGQKIALDILKAMMTKVGEVHSIRRQGFDFLYDPFNHVHIFASNFPLDKAMNRRCDSIELTDYTPGELKEIGAKYMLAPKGLTLTPDAWEIVVSRCKPYPGELEELLSPIVTHALGNRLKTVPAATVEQMLISNGFFKGGLRARELTLLNAMRKQPQTIAFLKQEVADEKKKSTAETVDWLCYSKLVMPVRNGFTLSEKGINYLKAIAERQQAARAAKK